MNQPIPRRVGVSPGAEGAAMPFAKAAIARGHIIAFPTETFYGLGADPAREDAVAAIFAAKGRSPGEALPLIAADTAAARGVAAVWSETAERLAAAFWPGPLTLVVPVRGGAVVAANRSGSPALTTADEVEHALGLGVALIVDGGPSPGGLASTIVDLSAGTPRLIRPGPVPYDRVLEFLR